VRAEQKLRVREPGAQILKDVRVAQNYFRRAKAWTGRECICLLSALTIVVMDLLLPATTRLVIALAVRQLPPRERRIGT